MYPRMKINLEKIEKNTQVIGELCAKQSVDFYAVTKVYCGLPEVARASIEGGAVALADSRIENLIKLKEFSCEKVLLRLPMLSEASRVVQWADISLNSEIETIKALGEAAKEKNKRHKIILMIDLGDLREGVELQDAVGIAGDILAIEGVELYGIGVNLTCYGGVIPDDKNLGELAALAVEIENTYDIKLQVVSGGNSSSIEKLKGSFPKRINNLRIGEAIVLGRETKEGNRIQGTFDDAFILEAQVVELKEKDSYPRGTIGMDAFGNKPVYEDTGRMLRGIIAIGRQDVNPDDLTPIDDRLKIIGASSDHMIVDMSLAQKDYKIGSVVAFKLTYGGVLSLSTSEYVEKVID